MCNPKFSNENPNPVVYTLEEVKTIKAVYNKLTTEKDIDPSRIGLRALALVSIISNSHVDDASAKYVEMLEALKIYSIESLAFTDTKEIEELMQDDDVQGIINNISWCGQDHEKRNIVWINKNECLPPNMERAYCIGKLLQWFAIHADKKTIHEGVTTIVDLSRHKKAASYGNEDKVKKLYHAFPMRSKSVKLAGTSFFIQIMLNFIIMIVSFVTRMNTRERIRFVTLEDAVMSIPKKSAPKDMNGGAGEIKDRKEWVKKRVLSLPVPSFT